jgi:maleate isomerase
MQFITPSFESYGTAVGLLVLTSDEAMETELREWLPPHIALHHARVTNAIEVNRETLGAMLAQIPNAVRQLPAAPDYKVIAYGCTSGSMVIGSDTVREAIQRIHADVAVTDPFMALKAKLNSVNAQRIGLLVPYEPVVAQGIVDDLQKDGFQIVASASFHESNDDRVCRISRASVREGLTAVGQDKEVQAVVASCTNLRVLDVLDEVSAELGKPVMSSNSALAWHIETLCGAG